MLRYREPAGRWWNLIRLPGINESGRGEELNAKQWKVGSERIAIQLESRRNGLERGRKPPEERGGRRRRRLDVGFFERYENAPLNAEATHFLDSPRHHN